MGDQSDPQERRAIRALRRPGGHLHRDGSGRWLVYAGHDRRVRPRGELDTAMVTRWLGNGWLRYVSPVRLEPTGRLPKIEGGRVRENSVSCLPLGKCPDERLSFHRRWLKTLADQEDGERLSEVVGRFIADIECAHRSPLRSVDWTLERVEGGPGPKAYEDAITSFEQRQSEQRLEQVCHRLTTPQAKALVSLLIEHRSKARVAADLQVSPATVSSALLRCVRILADVYQVAVSDAV